MTLLIELDMDNAAFEENPNELRNIFERIERLVPQYKIGDSFPIRDSNGNKIGAWRLAHS